MRCTESRYPLSPMQQGMVIASSRDPAAGVYVQQIVFSLQEELDTGCLREAWDLMIERHAILRSTVDLGPEGLFQTVQESVAIPWVEKDWSSLAPAAYETELQVLLAADRARGFNFVDGPPHRVTVIRRARAPYRFVWTHHHVLMDRHAQALLFRELFACYDARRHGSRCRLPPSPPRFADHIRWLNGQDWTRAERYWRRCLSGFREPVRLAIEADRRSGTGAENAYDRQVSSLSAELTRELESLAQRNGVTLNTLVQRQYEDLPARSRHESRARRRSRRNPYRR